VDKVVIGPDGALNLLPFAALVDDSNRSLIERYRLAYVSSGRELAREKGRTKAPESDLLLVANPAFDRVMTGGGKHADAVRSRSFNQTFTSLPGTEQEAQEIPLLVPGDKKRKRVLVGLEATAMAVKAARNPRILHLATHGFFLGDQAVQLSSSVRGISVKSSSEEESEKRVYENPLLRSGLAFAGANHAVQKDEGDDGLLTAYEISGMDLSGTELVVLSACETAVGQVHSGEGVFGLRRAFALAGAKVLMMSLWPIDDEITARQMKVFYQNLSKLPPAEALRQAQLDTIKELRAKHPSASPALWAPFIVQGAKAIQN
jgi:CHAT domain-containing protein